MLSIVIILVHIATIVVQMSLLDMLLYNVFMFTLISCQACNPASLTELLHAIRETFSVTCACVQRQLLTNTNCNYATQVESTWS